MRRTLTAVLLGALAATATADDADLSTSRRAVQAAEEKRIAAFEQAAKSVVCIYATPDRPGGGSGVIISEDGVGLTNFHVVQLFLDTRLGVGGLSDGQLYPLRVLGVDPGGDVALFQLEGRERWDFAPLGDSDSLRVGQWVAAMGNPFTLADDYTPTVTLGVISGLLRYQEGQGNVLEYADCIQVATSINPGNSGGPLFDLSGRVMGINGRISGQERGRVNVGLGYAISMKQIKRFLPGLKACRLMEHGTLGATVQQAGDDVIVGAIQELSPAEGAGLRLSDVVASVAGRRIRTPNDFNSILATMPANWPVEIVYRREGRELRGTARLERLPLKLERPYLLDIDRNQAMLRRELRLIGLRRGREATAVEGRLRLRIAVTASGAGRGVADVSLTADVAPEIKYDGQETARALLADWARLAEPALRLRMTGAGWELLGGDEVRGVTAVVVQQRDPIGARRRWAFADESGALLAMVECDDEGTERVRWEATDQADFSGLRWPGRWERVTPSGEAITIAVESVAAVAEGAP